METTAESLFYNLSVQRFDAFVKINTVDEKEKTKFKAIIQFQRTFTPNPSVPCRVIEKYLLILYEKPTKKSPDK